MTVFVVHPINSNGVSIEDARRFGEVRYVNDRFAYSDEIADQQLPPMFRKALNEAAREFNYDDDYLLIAGDHLQLVALSALLGSLYPSFSVLRWVRDANAYMPVRIHT